MATAQPRSRGTFAFLTSWYRHSLSNQLILMLVTPVALGLLILAAYVLYNVRIQSQADMRAHAETLIQTAEDSVADQMIELEEIASIQDAYLRSRFFDLAPYVTFGDPLTVEVTNQTTLEQHTATIPRWSIGEQVLTEDHSFVDAVQQDVGGVQTVFQRFDQGMLRISTNIRLENGERAVFTYFPLDHEIVQTVLSGQAYVGRALVTGQWHIAKYSPIVAEDGEVVGMLFSGFSEASSARRLATTLGELKVGESGFFWIFTSDGTMLAHPQLAGRVALDAHDADGNPYVRRIMAEKAGWLSYELLDGDDSRAVQTRFTYFAPRDWYLALTIFDDEAFAAAEQLQSAIITIALVILAVLILIITLTGRQLLRPIGLIGRAARQIAEGRQVQELPVERRDEIGRMAADFGGMVSYLRQISGAANRLADGDLTVDVPVQSDEDALGLAFRKMIHQWRRIVQELQSSVTQLDSSVGSLHQAADQAGQTTGEIAGTMQHIARGAITQNTAVTQATGNLGRMRESIAGVANGAIQQTDTITRASGVVNELVAAAEQVSANAETVARDSSGAAQVARQGAETVSAAINGMVSIRESVSRSAARVTQMGEHSRQIGTVLTSMQEIAELTNLLALNASIEAARAGDHGRGFAVVASEVRKLAVHAAEATNEIGDLIHSMQQSIEEAVVAMNNGSQAVEAGTGQAQAASMALGEILRVAESVQQQAGAALQVTQTMQHAASALVETMSDVRNVASANTSATAAMSSGAGEVSTAVDHIAAVSAENSSAAEQVSSSAGTMASQVRDVAASAQLLAGMTRNLRATIAQFHVAAEA
jgi:methyl-accepting chemotaxis protein